MAMRMYGQLRTGSVLKKPRPWSGRAMWAIMGPLTKDQEGCRIELHTQRALIIGGRGEKGVRKFAAKLQQLGSTPYTAEEVRAMLPKMPKMWLQSWIPVTRIAYQWEAAQCAHMEEDGDAHVSS